MRKNQNKRKTLKLINEESEFLSDFQNQKAKLFIKILNQFENKNYFQKLKCFKKLKNSV